MPSYGATTVCSIFIASSTSTGWPAATGCPCSTATRTTLPGIGARSEPVATWSAGSTNRGSRVRATWPCTESTSTTSPRTVTSKAVSTPSTWRVTRSGATRTARMLVAPRAGASWCANR